VLDLRCRARVAMGRPDSPAAALELPPA
jgi:hypothetical protein